MNPVVGDSGTTTSDPRNPTNLTEPTSLPASLGGDADPEAEEEAPTPPAAPIVMSSRDPDAIFSGGGIRFLSLSLSLSLSHVFQSFCLLGSSVTHTHLLFMLFLWFDAVF
jgi:hypothetical protein